MSDCFSSYDVNPIYEIKSCELGEPIVKFPISFAPLGLGNHGYLSLLRFIRSCIR